MWKNFYSLLCIVIFSFLGVLHAADFFITGDLKDLVSIREHSLTNVGKITVLTQPIASGTSQGIHGHTGVTTSVLRGFKKLHIPMNYNPRTIEEVGEHVFVLFNVQALHQAVKLKKQGRIKTLIVGPNIMNWPNEENHLLGVPEIDWYISPCEWARISCGEEEPLVKGKTAIWYAGVDTDAWQPRDIKKETKSMLIYWKTEPEAFCKSVEDMAHKYGWQTHRIRYGYYNKEQYKQLLEKVDAAIFISVSESQGLALAECWSMNVPTLVWSPGTAYIFKRWIPCTAGPYVTPATGCLWRTLDDLDLVFSRFEQIKTQFAPRSWTVDYMSDEASICLLLDLIKYTVYKNLKGIVHEE